MALRSLLFVSLALAVSACDSDPGGTTGAAITLSGTVTDDDASSLTKSAGPVEGATVVASSVNANGSLNALSGSATTSASGSFSLETEATTDIVLLTASDTGFDSRALLEAGAAAGARAEAAPMTFETDAEAGVLLAARRDAPTTDVADAVYFVTAEVAADVQSGATTTADVAAALAASLNAEREAAENQNESVEEERPRVERREDYTQLRIQLRTAASAEQRAAAVARFEEGYADAYASAGLSARSHARVSSARAKTTLRFSRGLSADARLAVRRRARLAAARATALAVEAEFAAQNAATERREALAEARARFVADLQAATSDDEMAEAESAYAASVRSEIQAETGISSLTMRLASQSSSVARATLNTAVSAATSASVIVTAVTSFYATVESGATSAFGAEADLAVRAFVLVSIY